jgi:hypothetical protein
MADEKALEAGDERIKKLDKMLCTRFARSAPIEEALLQIGMGKRGLPTREECKEWGITLGVPDDVRAVLTATKPGPEVAELVDWIKRNSDHAIECAHPRPCTCGLSAILAKHKDSVT